jgi:RNA polymerase sigma factor (sigma-70 family)
MNTAGTLINIDNKVPLSEGKLHLFRPDHMSDGALWNSFRKGDEKAFAIIFDRNVKLLYNYGMKITVDSILVKDSVQELFIELWKNHQNLGETDSIKFYLYKSIRRKLIRAKSRKSLNGFVKLPMEYSHESIPSAECDMVDAQTSIEKKQQITQLLNTLSKRQREAVFLRYFEEMEYEKIASVMELSKQVVYNLVNRAIASLRTGISIVTVFLFFCCK